jgi:hypothetical protein
MPAKSAYCDSANCRISLVSFGSLSPLYLSFELQMHSRAQIRTLCPVRPMIASACLGILFA